MGKRVLETYTEDQQKEIARLLANKFIARKDVKAIQRSNGDYNPIPSKFTMADLLTHLRGEATYGHYLLNENNECKLFVFDLDLDKTDPTKPEITYSLPTNYDENGSWATWTNLDPREIYLRHEYQATREFMQFQLRLCAHKIARMIQDLLEVPVAVSATGSKGLHVYGFTGLMPAQDVREAAEIVIAGLKLQVEKGNNFFKFVPDLEANFDPRCITIEVFPKQTTLEGKTHGNLVRLPLGKNLKAPNEPTFFMDMTGNFGDECFKPKDAIEALTSTNIWA